MATQTHLFPTHDALKTRTVQRLPNGQFMVPFVSSSSDDYYSVDFWEHYDIRKFEFSSNITIVAAAALFNGGAVLVEKKDPSLPETLYVRDPDTGNRIAITF